MSTRNLQSEERETVINSTDADGVIRIWTAQLGYLGRLRRDPRFTQVRSGFYGTTAWGEFTIPADQWNPVTGAKRASGHSAERRAEQAARMRALRAKQQVKQQGDDTEPTPVGQEDADDADSAVHHVALLPEPVDAR